MSAKPKIVTGEVKVDLGGGVTGDVGSAVETLDRLMSMAAEIWRAVERSGVSINDDTGNDELMKRLQHEYKDFVISYPIPFRWMVQAREYEPRAFKKFLQEQVKAMYKDRHEFMAAQGEYLVILYKIRHPRAGVRQISRYREAIKKSLKEDDDTFTAAREEADEEVKRLDAEVDAARRERIVAYLQRLKVERRAAPAARPHPVEEYLSQLRARQSSDSSS